MGHARNLAAVLFGCALLIGCNSRVSENGPGGSASGVASPSLLIHEAYLSPNPITRTGPVSVSLGAQDFGRDGITYRYRWYVNDALIPGETNTQLPVENLKRGDLVVAEIIPTDGRVTGPAYKTPAAKVSNALPTVLNVGLPQQVMLGEPVRAEVSVKDLDNDEVRTRFRWWKNRDMVAETEELTLETSGFVRGDTIRVSVIPRDGIGEGSELFSPSIVVGNSSPHFTSNPPATVEKGVYQYLASAVDPDGDPISFELEHAPSGMTIDMTTGQLHWSIPVGLTGSQQVRIVAKDNQGGQFSQEFELTPSVPASAKPTGA